MRTAIIKFFDYFSEGFSTTDWASILLPFKIISACFSIGLLLIIIYLIFQIRKDIKKFLEIAVESITADAPGKVSIEGWQSVLDKMESGNEANYKLAVIEADKIFDDLLKKNGYQGRDMGERLKNITSDQLVNIDDVWQSHKMRNRLVHEPDFQLKEHEVRRIIEIYEKALNYLEAI